MKKVTNYNFADFLVLAISVIYFSLTLIIWPTISIGWYVLGLTALAVALAIYYAVQNHNKNSLLLWLVFYFIFIEIYFYYFRTNLPNPGPFTANVDEVNWGSAFFALIVVWLTPFFIALDSFDLTANILRNKKSR